MTVTRARRQTSTFGWVWVSALGAFWGLSVAAARVSLSAGMNPVAFAVCETGIISVIGVVIVLVRRNRLPHDRARWKLWAVNGVFVVVIPYLVSYTALAHLTAGEVTVVLALSPVMTTALAVAVGAERWNWQVPAGALACLAGVAAVAAAAASAPGSKDSTLSHGWWVLIATLSPLCYAIANVYVVSQSARTSVEPIVNVLGSNALGFVALGAVLGVAVSCGWMRFTSVEVSVALPFLVVAALANASANLLFFVAARHTSASVLALSGYLTTIFGVLFGIILANERWSWPLMAGGVLIVVGVYIGTRKPRRDHS